ncbi:hypothetical protein AB0D66_30490 [Streptomyces sp. NPDC048270]|uniref:hypothetical protein n=1 Tax=Streptomyces sp. NPDC048270 TaxID=3154615 RepID=UPI0033DDA0BA
MSVWDGNPDPPVVMPTDPYRIGQHGLEVIVAAADGIRTRREAHGKQITAGVVMTG